MSKTITAILSLTAIEITALLTGHNGLMLTTIVAAIAGLGGVSLGRFWQQRHQGP